MKDQRLTLAGFRNAGPADDDDLNGYPYFDDPAGDDDAKPAARRAPIIRSFADIERRPIRWLWTNRIARGKLTALVSAPGDGKSTMTCDLAARLSSGSKWPDGDDSAGAADTLLINGEDDPHDQLRPRLEAAGADLSRVALLSGIRVPREDGTDAEQLWQLPDLDVLAAALDARPETAFICIDPLNSFIGGATDAHRDNEVRAVLGPLKKLAEDRGVAVLLVMHHRKGRGRNADEAVMGSRAFTGIVRQVWHVVRDAEDAARRLLLPGKTNICAEGGGLAYSIRGDGNGDPVVAWEADPVEMSADDGLAALAKAERDTGDDEADHRQSKLDLAGNFIADLLLDGPRAWADVAKAGRQAGHMAGTLERARGTVAETFKCGAAGGWFWRKIGDARDAPTAPKPEKDDEVDEVDELRFSGPSGPILSNPLPDAAGDSNARKGRKSGTSSTSSTSSSSRKSGGKTGRSATTHDILNGGISKSHEAINSLTRIPRDDPLRERAFQIVGDWIDHNGGSE